MFFYDYLRNYIEQNKQTKHRKYVQRFISWFCEVSRGLAWSFKAPEDCIPKREMSISMLWYTLDYIDKEDRSGRHKETRTERKHLNLISSPYLQYSQYQLQVPGDFPGLEKTILTSVSSVLNIFGGTNIYITCSNRILDCHKVMHTSNAWFWGIKLMKLRYSKIWS